MNNEQIWQLRGLYSSIAQLQADVLAMVADRKLTATRQRDFKRNLEHLAERIDGVVAAGEA